MDPEHVSSPFVQGADTLIYGNVENEDPESEDSKTRRPFTKTKTITKTKTHYENEDTLQKRRPPLFFNQRKTKNR